MALDLLVNSLSSAWFKISPVIINFSAALLLLLAGYLLAKLVGFLITLFLKSIQFDKFAKQLGIAHFLEKGEVKKTVSELIGDLFYWIIIFVTVGSLTGLLGLPIDPLLTKIFTYLALVLLAALILGIGNFFASFFAALVRVIAANLGLEGARTLGRVIYYIVIIFTFLVALAQLGIGPEAFIPQLGVIIGAVGLAAAIAFGLGCKDMAADFLHNIFFKGR